MHVLPIESSVCFTHWVKCMFYPLSQIHVEGILTAKIIFIMYCLLLGELWWTDDRGQHWNWDQQLKWFPQATAKWSTRLSSFNTIVVDSGNNNSFSTFLNINNLFWVMSFWINVWFVVMKMLFLWRNPPLVYTRHSAFVTSQYKFLSINLTLIICDIRFWFITWATQWLTR